MGDVIRISALYIQKYLAVWINGRRKREILDRIYMGSDCKYHDDDGNL